MRKSNRAAIKCPTPRALQLDNVAKGRMFPAK
jgi:hypothetical protein